MVNKVPGEEVPRHLRVRCAQKRDRAKVEKFYNKNQGLGRGSRDLAAIFDVSELARLYIVEETQSNSIVAAGACVAHCEGHFVELRSGLVRWKGYGLHRLLTYIRTVQSLVMTNADVAVFSVVLPDELKLRERMSGLGFEPWTDVPAELANELVSVGHNLDAYMKFIPERLDEHRRRLLEVCSDRRLRHVVTGEEAALTLDILLNKDPHFREAHLNL